MSLSCYLAMTEAEIRANSALPHHLAFMACHFSPYGVGLVNIPQRLPKGSILIVNDRVPVLHHEPQVVLRQLQSVCKQLSLRGILLDFEIPNCQKAMEIVHILVRSLPCPVCVSENYGEALSCPVFVSPPLNLSLRNTLQKWQGRKIWLEASLWQQQFILTREGCAPKFCDSCPDGTYFTDENLCCSYTFSLSGQAATFTLKRGKKEMEALLKQAENLNVELCVGLYQQLGK